MSRKAPGKSYRAGLTLGEMKDMFPDEAAATEWFESVIWPDQRHCPKCGSFATREVPKRKPMPYWCSACRSYFSVKTGTAMQNSRIPLRKWAIAIYLCLTSLKSVSSMKLQRDIGVSQPTAWFMLHRIREAWAHEDDDQFDGPVEVDESYFGGKRKNMSLSKRKALKDAEVGPGTVGKTAVVGMKDRDSNEIRAEIISDTTGDTLQGFVRENAEEGSTVYTDEHKSYKGLGLDFEHEAVNHSVGEYVDGMAHTNGIESFWSMLKRAHKGTFHKISPKHLQRYVHEFAGKHNIRESDAIVQMRDTVAHLIGRRLLYCDLVACNGRSNGRGR
ncbi:MAG: IS1595 family transposase [Albidovulum sp.]|nr:IS1595 family transposase [Albidovulum sp.]